MKVIIDTLKAIGSIVKIVAKDPLTALIAGGLILIIIGVMLFFINKPLSAFVFIIGIGCIGLGFVGYIYERR